MTPPDPPQELMNTGVRIDPAERDEWVALLKLEDRENNFSAEIRRMIRRDIAKRKAQQNGGSS